LVYSGKIIEVAQLHAAERAFTRTGVTIRRDGGLAHCCGAQSAGLELVERCASTVASEYLPARLNSAILALVAATSPADDGAASPALASSASHAIRTNQSPDS
jgi:hypothetical protein